MLIGTREAQFSSINAGRLHWYRSSKAAAHKQMLSLAYELKPSGVAVGKVIGIIDRPEVANTGKFWDYQGGQLRW